MEPGVTAVALERYEGVLWSVRVHVGGEEEMFLLDTAAGLTALVPRVAARLGLTADDAVTARRMTGEELTIPLGGPATIALGDRALAHDRVGIVDLGAFLPAGWPPLGGVLGLTTFARRPVLIDLGVRELLLASRLDLEQRAGGMAPLHIRLEPPPPAARLDVFVRVESADGPLWLELDTGNAGPVILSPKAASAVGLDGDGGDATLDVTGLGPVTTAAVVKPIIHDGNLGSPFLDGRALGLDLERGRAWLSPAGGALARIMHDPG